MAFVLESILNRRWAFALLASVAALALLLSACGDDDEEEDEHAGMAMASVTAEAHDEEEDEEEDEHAGMAMASGTAGADGEESHEMAHDDTMPGVVHPKPAGATEVRVSLAEWTVHPSVTSVAAGEIYFLVDNLGPEHPHSFSIIRTDLAADALPTIHDGSVSDDAVDLVGEIEAFEPASSASAVFHLTPGTYVLVCNEVETTGGLEVHYGEGMTMAFTVE